MHLHDTIHRHLATCKLARNSRRILLLEDIKAGYVPVPKVASSSLRSMVCERQAAVLYPDTLALPPDRRQALVEQRIRRSLGPYRVCRLKREYFLFAFVRHPLMRLYSCYVDKVVQAVHKGKRFTLRRYGVDPAMGFDEFVRHIAEIPDSQAEQHFRSQHCYLFHRRRPLVHFIGKLEHMDRDWEALRQRLGPGVELARKRGSGAGTLLGSLPLDHATATLAVARYRDDIDLLGYGEETDHWLIDLADNHPRTTDPSLFRSPPP